MVRKLLDLPGYSSFYKGKPITTMTYDFWVGKRGNRHDGTRFNLQEILLSQLTNFLYDDGSGEPGAEPSWWGREKKRSISTWSSHIELLAMVEDTHDGEFFAVPPDGNGHVQPNAGPVGVGTLPLRALAAVDPDPRGGGCGDAAGSSSAAGSAGSSS